MAARTRELNTGATIIPFDRPSRRRQPAREVVAVILSDGTVRQLGERHGDDGHGPYAAGQLSGENWILWWQRREFDPR